MIKRLFDFLCAFLGMLVLSPVFILFSILIKLDSTGPIFFRQKRVGLHGKDFSIYKFRSMRVAQDKKALKITVGKDNRITKLGAFIRKTKLDELPQLINIIKGDMSLVGPRPEVPEYVKYYSDNDKKIIFSVRPGITDIASIRFRNESDILATKNNPEQAYIDEIMPIKLRYCRFYVKKQSLFLDIKLILQTLKIL